MEERPERSSALLLQPGVVLAVAALWGSESVGEKKNLSFSFCLSNGMGINESIFPPL